MADLDPSLTVCSHHRMGREKRGPRTGRERAAAAESQDPVPLDRPADLEPPRTAICPGCEGAIGDEAMVARCATCRVFHHAECFQEESRCASAGCTGREAAVQKGWRTVAAECTCCEEAVRVGDPASTCTGCGAIHHAACFGEDGCASCEEHGATLGPAREPTARELARVRCPYCHDDVVEDQVGARCASCQTVHHAGCFEERGACSVDGCGGRAARVGAWRRDLGGCPTCEGPVHADELVAACASCAGVHHATCFERTGRCGSCAHGQANLIPGGALEAARAARLDRLRGTSVWLLDHAWVPLVGACLALEARWYVFLGVILTLLTVGSAIRATLVRQGERRLLSLAQESRRVVPVSPDPATSAKDVL